MPPPPPTPSAPVATSSDSSIPAASPPASNDADGDASTLAGREIELKLLVAPGDADRLKTLPLLQERSVGPLRTRTLHSIYYDTPERDLLRQGLALRVRSAGADGGEGDDAPHFIQTVKAQERARAGLFERREAEATVERFAPDLERIADDELGEAIRKTVGPKPLEAVLETRVERTSQRVASQGSRIDCDLDFGEIRTPAGRLPIHELELELATGDPRDLYALALDVHEQVPLHVGLRSKYERGLALLTGERPAPRKAARLRLDRDATLEEALEAILESALGQILANEEAALDGTDPEGVHQMRIGVRRLRSVLALVRELLPAEQYEFLRDELRWLADALAGVRDLDVFAIETLSPVLSIFPHDGGLKRLADATDSERRRAHQAFSERVASPRYAGLVLGLAGWIQARGWRDQGLSPEAAALFQPARGAARRVLDARARKVRRLGHDIATRSLPELHQVRIELKKLRYAAEFFGSLFEKRSARSRRRYTRAMARMQDVLGGLNDTVVAETTLEAVIESMGEGATPDVHRAGGMVLGWCSRSARDQLGALPKHWARLEKRAPFWRERD